MLNNLRLFFGNHFILFLCTCVNIFSQANCIDKLFQCTADIIRDFNCYCPYFLSENIIVVFVCLMTIVCTNFHPGKISVK